MTTRAKQSGPNLFTAAGLDKAVERFPDCVADAARAAAQDRNDMPQIDGSSEPWPPMRVGSKL